MRLATGGAPGASLHDMWVFQRDHQRPATSSEIDAFADALAPMPPSRAHIKRILRLRPEVSPCGPERAPLPDPDGIAFLKSQRRVLRDLGVLAKADDGVRAPLPKVTVERGVATPLTPEMRKVRFDQRIAESIRLVRIARVTPFGVARRDILARATKALRDA